jgi:hypothetical protein
MTESGSLRERLKSGIAFMELEAAILPLRRFLESVFLALKLKRAEH